MAPGAGSDKSGRGTRGRRTGGLNQWPTDDESGAGERYPIGKEKPRRANHTGRDDWLGLPTVAGEGGEKEKQSKEETQGEVP